MEKDYLTRYQSRLTEIHFLKIHMNISFNVQKGIVYI